MPVKSRLDPVDETLPQDMVIGGQGKLPLFEGMEEESLVCPGCGDQVTNGISAQTVMSLFEPPDRLLFHCDCGAYSLIGIGQD